MKVEVEIEVDSAGELKRDRGRDRDRDIVCVCVCVCVCVIVKMSTNKRFIQARRGDPSMPMTLTRHGHVHRSKSWLHTTCGLRSVCIFQLEFDP